LSGKTSVGLFPRWFNKVRSERRDNSCSEWPFRWERRGEAERFKGLPSHPSARLFLPETKYGGCLSRKWLLNFDLIQRRKLHGAISKDLSRNFLILYSRYISSRYIFYIVACSSLLLNYILILRPRKRSTDDLYRSGEKIAISYCTNKLFANAEYFLRSRVTSLRGNVAPRTPPKQYDVVS